MAEGTSLGLAVRCVINEDDSIGRIVVKAQASFQVTVFHLQQLALMVQGEGSALRFTSALTPIVQQMGMSQSGFGQSLSFMSTIRKGISSSDDH